ncbi:MAG TPA: tetratricopeptide repeat protein [Polyangia bacterium]|nr:tetratricopeptide repeat protein [Polyangia bacterium]
MPAATLQTGGLQSATCDRRFRYWSTFRAANDYFPTLVFVARAAAFAVSMAAIVSVSPAAFAQSGAEADAAISKGVVLRRQGKDEEALEFFQRANKLAPSPRAKAQIGPAEQAIGRWPTPKRI